MMSARRFSRPLLALILMATPSGCSRGRDDLPRVPVSGTVTMDGKPLPEGVILFSPIGEATASSAGATGAIKEGTFSIPREDGPVPGNHRVSISRTDVIEVPAVKGKQSIGAGRKRLGPELIPARYNSKSELTRQIKRGGATDLTFELRSR
jgi:hypothetical protein